MLIRKATLCSFGSRLTPPLIKIAVKIVNRPSRSPHGTRLQGYERELLLLRDSVSGPAGWSPDTLHIFSVADRGPPDIRPPHHYASYTATHSPQVDTLVVR